MSDANPLILPHHTNYCFFANIKIGDIIGDNRSFISDICTIIGVIIGANIEFIGNISYDTLQSGIHDSRISYGKDVNN